MKPKSNHCSLKIPNYWILLWIIIYLAILTLSLFLPQSAATTFTKLSGIFFCAVYSIVTFPKDRLLQIAMIITFIADCFLAYDNVSLIGLTIFFLAQISHLYRLSPDKRRYHVAIFAIIGLFCIICNLIFHFIPPLYIVVFFYATTLISNIITSTMWYRKEPTNIYAKFAFFGFVLFGCCDLCTILSYCALIDLLPNLFYGLANFLAWFFYYPSQIFVSNSSKCATIGIKEGKC